jgi:hypothetical protein
VTGSWLCIHHGPVGATAVEVRLDVGLGELEARRAAVHNHTHTPAVGFTPRRDERWPKVFAIPIDCGRN